MDRLSRREVCVWGAAVVKQYAFKDPVNAFPTAHSHMLLTATI